MPNAAAQALRGGRTGLIAFWMCLGYSRYRSQVADEMQKVLSEAGLAMAVCDADNEFIFEHSLDRVLRLPVDGIVALDGFVAAGAFAERYHRQAPPVPFVSMGAYWTDAYSFVGVDLHVGAVAAAEHLLERGRRRIAYLAPWNSGLLTEGPRYEGYREAMLRAGREPVALSVESSGVDAIAASLGQAQAEGRLPDAIFFLNDDLAMDAVSALERLGLRPGDDVALVGFNGTEGTEKGSCPLSTVRQPVPEMCRLAYEFLQAQIDDPQAAPRQRMLEPELIVRRSSTTQ